jgi:uncharacterized membrane protein YfhO
VKYGHEWDVVILDDQLCRQLLIYFSSSFLSVVLLFLLRLTMARQILFFTTSDFGYISSQLFVALSINS